jgi:3-methyladenine DNA glycosylase AlkD
MMPRERAAGVLAWLDRRGTRKSREAMARYAIHAEKAFGVPMATLQKLAKTLGRDHELAAALWESGWYEARLLAALVDEPARVTPAQMDRWCRTFENWADCDTACFFLFDKTPHAFGTVARWAGRRGELQKRAAFALLASLALHDRRSPDAPFRKGLVLVEGGAKDDRNLVKKGVSWALRAVGERSAGLHAAALLTARKLAASKDPAARWVGADALRQLTAPAALRRLEARTRRQVRERKNGGRG